MFGLDTSPIIGHNHTCSWRDKLILLWALNRQAKIFLHKLLFDDMDFTWCRTVEIKRIIFLEERLEPIVTSSSKVLSYIFELLFSIIYTLVVTLKASKVTFNFASFQHRLLNISVLLVMSCKFQVVSWYSHLHARLSSEEITLTI